MLNCKGINLVGTHKNYHSQNINGQLQIGQGW